MRSLSLLAAFGLITSLHATAGFDKSDLLNGVELKSGKEDQIRSFSGTISKKFPYSLETVKRSVTNFSEKCNNSYKSKRKFSSEDLECKYHNDHLIESFLVTDIKRPEGTNASDFYLLGRQVYNRGSYGYYELVQIQNGVNHKGQPTLTVSLRMLEDQEVEAYTKPKFSKESAFDKSQSIYTLVQVSPSETLLTYEYRAETDHWILNKEISVPQVFASISKSINDLLKTVESESSLQKRALASKQ